MTTRGKHLDALFDKIQAGTMTYEDTADLFLLTMVGQPAGVTRDEMLARLRARFQDTVALNAFLQASLGQFDALVRGRS